MTETWKPVVGWEGSYEVSDVGRVRSVDRVVTQMSRWGVQHRRLRGQILRPTPLEKTGHLVVDLSVGGRRNRKRRLVHRLELEAFVGPCPADMEGCHFNDVADDNRLENLRWDTPSANQRDKVRNGRHHYASRTECSNGHAFTPENTNRRSDGLGGRRCKRCESDKRAKTSARHQEYKRAWRAQRRAEGRRAS